MDRIINAIYEKIISDIGYSSDISILTGTSGQILFLAYHYNTTREQNVKTSLEELIGSTLEYLSGADPSEINFTYGGGLAGFYWVINHIIQNKLLFQDTEALTDIISEESDQDIAASLAADFSCGKFDPLYGYIGKGFYFLSRPKSAFTNAVIHSILKSLKRDRIVIDEKRIAWPVSRKKLEGNSDDNETMVLGDLGMAHGVVGIIAFLVQVLTNERNNDLSVLAEELLEPSVRWLISQEIPSGEGRVYRYPPTVNLVVPHLPVRDDGRLGWCYGDNVVAYVLYQSAAILSNEEFRLKADEIAMECAKVEVRRSGVVGVADRKFNPTLCHGAAGISLIFDKLRAYNTSPVIEQSAKFWKDQTVLFTSEYLESSGLRSIIGREGEANDFLYGYTGIGLYLLAESRQAFNWQACLFLN